MSHCLIRAGYVAGAMLHLHRRDGKSAAAVPFSVKSYLTPNDLREVVSSENHLEELIDPLKPNFPGVDHILLTNSHLLLIQDTISADPFAGHDPGNIFDAMSASARNLAGSAESPDTESLCNAIYRRVSAENFEPVPDDYKQLVSPPAIFGWRGSPRWQPQRGRVTPIYVVLSRTWSSAYRPSALVEISDYVRIAFLDDIVRSNLLPEAVALQLARRYA
jgi:hypothetical protein